MEDRSEPEQTNGRSDVPALNERPKAFRQGRSEPREEIPDRGRSVVRPQVAAGMNADVHRGGGGAGVGLAVFWRGGGGGRLATIALQPVVAKGDATGDQLVGADGDPGGGRAVAVLGIVVFDGAAGGEGANVVTTAGQHARERAAAAEPHREDAVGVDAQVGLQALEESVEESQVGGEI